MPPCMHVSPTVIFRYQVKGDLQELFPREGCFEEARIVWLTTNIFRQTLTWSAPYMALLFHAVQYTVGQLQKQSRRFSVINVEVVTTLKWRECRASVSCSSFYLYHLNIGLSLHHCFHRLQMLHLRHKSKGLCLSPGCIDLQKYNRLA